MQERTPSNLIAVERSIVGTNFKTTNWWHRGGYGRAI